MELLNHINKADVKNILVFETLIKLLSPFAPYLCLELWTRLGHEPSVFNETWPDYVEEYTSRKTVQYVVQINGKVRAKLNIHTGLTKEETDALVLADPKVQQWIRGKQIVKKIFVPDKSTNLVVV